MRIGEEMPTNKTMATHPVRHQRYFACSATAALAALVFRFLMFCASSLLQEPVEVSYENEPRAVAQQNDLPMTILNHFTPNSADAPPTFFVAFLGIFLTGLPNRSLSESSSSEDSSPFLSDEREATKLVLAPCSDARVWNVVICHRVSRKPQES